MRQGPAGGESLFRADRNMTAMRNSTVINNAGRTSIGLKKHNFVEDHVLESASPKQKKHGKNQFDLP